MTGIFEQLGVGAVFACLALPVLTSIIAAQLPSTDPQSRHGVLMWPLVLSAALFGVPWLRQVIAHTSEVAVPAAVLTPVLAEPVADAAAPAMTWSLLAAAGALWCALVALSALRLFGQWVRLRRLIARAIPADERRLIAVSQCARQLGVACPRVVVSEEAGVPFVTGLLDPVLVLPSAVLERLGEEQLSLVLHHELTHLARGDHRVAPLLSLLRLLFPFHPTAARLMEELALAREESVDARIEADQLHTYAQLLVTVTAMARERRGVIPVLGMADPSLRRRIAVLTSRQPRPLARFGPVTLVGALLIAGGLAAPKAVASEPAAEPPAAMEQSTPVALGVGLQRVLDIPDITRVAVGDPAICDIKTIGSHQLLLTGSAPGSTSVLVWKSNGTRVSYTVTVSAVAATPPAVGGTTLALGVGAQKVITVAGIQRVAIGDTDIADIRTIGNNQLLIIGRQAGKTTLLVWKGGGQRLEYTIAVGP